MNDGKRRIDWQGIYQQLANNRRALEKTFGTDHDDMQQRQRRRAEKLALRSTEKQQQARTPPVFVFNLDQHRFAFDLRCFVKVARLQKIVPVPGGPAGLLGVGNVEGEIYSVLDLRLPLGIGRPEDAYPPYLLLLGWQQIRLGVCADAIVEVVRFRDDEVRRSHDQPAHVLKWSYGIGPDGTVLLDAEKLLTSIHKHH